jgi:anti-sigma regulatory factor (Ser/Thr protein kinase)
MRDAVSITLANQRSEIDRLVGFVDEFAARHSLSPDVVFALQLALDEIFMNVVRHAHDDGLPHEIGVRLALEEGIVTTVVEDDGRAFDPLSVPPADIEAAIEDRPIGGLGVHLVRSIMDTVEYRREHGKNVLVMRKAASAS